MASNAEDRLHESTPQEPAGGRANSSSFLPRGSSYSRAGGIAGALVGFALGSAFTYFGLHYFEKRSADDSAERAIGRDMESAGSAPPLRMSYELARLPKQAPATDAHMKPPSTAASAKPAAPLPNQPVPGAVAEQPAPGERVINARPITTVPPDTRDTTREIEKEAQSAPSRGRERLPAPEASVAPQPKTSEGRELQLSSQPDKMPRPRPHVLQKKAVSSPPVPIGATAGPDRPNTAAPQGTTTERSAPAADTPAPGLNEGASLRLPDSLDDIVAMRIEATRAWLVSSLHTTHTIQLLGTHGDAQLRGQLQSLSKMLDPERLYVFRTIAQGKPALTVVYGSYADRQSAQEALANLPPAAAAFQPVLRTVNGIRAELKKHGKEL